MRWQLESIRSCVYSDTYGILTFLMLTFKIEYMYIYNFLIDAKNL